MLQNKNTSTPVRSSIYPNTRTRMHSSRMLTVHCSGRLRGWGWGGFLPGGVYPGGCLPGGCLPRRGCLPQGGSYPGECLPDTPLWTESQTGVKTLPCCNYAADGNKVQRRFNAYLISCEGNRSQQEVILQMSPHDPARWESIRCNSRTRYQC